MRAAARLVCLLAVSLCTASALAKQPIAQTGVLQDAPWRIDVPAQWNGELIMLAHGYEPVGVPRAAAWPANEATAGFLSAGYAVAQSGYSKQGWAVTEGVADTERLRQHFLAQHPDTRRTWVLGYSMGGAIAIASLEQHPAHYDGGVSLCGANVPGAVLASELLTTLVAFDYFFPNAAGLPAAGLTSADAAALPQMQLYQGIAGALQTQPQIAQQLAAKLEVKPDELAGVISLHALVLHDMATRLGGMPVGNVGVAYTGLGDDAAFNAGVKRITADSAAQAKANTQWALTGALQRPLVIQFNHADPTITPRMQSQYAALAARAGAGPAPQLLPPVGQGHCDFSNAQALQALQTLSKPASPPAAQ